MSILVGATSACAGAAGSQAAAADLGETIDQSLRFRDSTLSRTLTNHTSFTASMWIKRGLFGTEQTFFEFSAADADLRFTANDELKYFDNATAGTSDMLFRDPSAWYHIVLAYDNDGTGGLGSDTVRIYVNGADSGIRTSAGGNSGGGSTVLGSSAFEGYIAEFNYVQSTQLPTAFGRYNEDGVWVPITFEGTYGAQGVHLVFDSSAGIGDDTSGNGNDFTASGFNTTAISSSNKHNDIDFNDTPTSNYGTLNSEGSTTGQFADFANLHFTSTSPGTWQGGYGTFPMQSGKWYWEYHSNGANGLVGISSNHQAAPSVASDTGELGYQLETGNIRNGGTSSSYGATAGSGDVIGVAFDADNGTIWFSKNDTWLNSATQSEVEAGTTTNAAVSGLDTDLIWVPFVAATREDHFFNFGQMDFLSTKPTGYEALYTNKIAEPTIKNGGDHFQAIAGPGTAGGSGGNQGLWMPDLFTAPPGTRAQAHQSTASVFQSGETGKLRAFDGNTSTVAETSQSEGRPGWMSFRPSDTTVSGLTATSTFKVKVRRIAEMYVNGTQMTGDFTTNTGSLFDLSSQLTFPFTLESFEIGAISGQDAGLFGIELDGDYLIQQGILETAQATYSNGLYWVKDRDNNSTQHQLVDTVRGTTANIKKCPGLANTAAYSAPSGNSIAWCWNAPDAMDQTTRESGSIDVTAGRVNQDAGFSIIEFEGNETNGATVAHGLTEAPEFIIAIAQDNTNSIPVWHYKPDGTSLLNGTSEFSLTHVQSVSSTLVTMGGNSAINTNNGTCSMYCWHSVPGYCAIGNYESNGDDDGPYIYTGFRPAMVILKSGLGATGDWVIIDSTRNTFNPSNTWLQPNSTDAESSPSTGKVDFLANGFKLRNGISTFNGADDGRTYVYACWAENPFGGENAPPATAR